MEFLGYKSIRASIKWHLWDFAGLVVEGVLKWFLVGYYGDASYANFKVVRADNTPLIICGTGHKLGQQQEQST
jgi:hypothetical protein